MALGAGVVRVDFLSPPGPGLQAYKRASVPSQGLWGFFTLQAYGKACKRTAGAIVAGQWREAAHDSGLESRRQGTRRADGKVPAVISKSDLEAVKADLA